MDTRHLQNFVVVGEEENFRRAADRLHLEQSALSRHVQALESEIGVELFERLPRGVRLSLAGKTFLIDARRILELANEAADRARRVASGRSGILRVAMCESGSMYNTIPRSIREFSELYPDVEVELLDINSAFQTEALAVGRVDVGLLYGTPDDDPILVRHEIHRQDVVLALPASHPLAARPRIALADLEREPQVWVSRAANYKLFDEMMAAWKAAGRTPRIVHTVHSGAGVLSLVSAGVGLGMALSEMPFRQPEDVVLRPVEDFSVPFRIDLVWRRDNRLPVVKKFVERTIAIAKADSLARRTPQVLP